MATTILLPCRCSSSGLNSSSDALGKGPGKGWLTTGWDVFDSDEVIGICWLYTVFLEPPATSVMPSVTNATKVTVTVTTANTKPCTGAAILVAAIIMTKN